MLTLRLTPYTSSRWAWNGTAYTTDDHASEIRPYQHPLVEQLAISDAYRTTLIVRERAADRLICSPQVRTVTPVEYDQATDAARRWPLDYVMIETRPHHPVRVIAGAPRTTPLYLAHSGGVLHGSWEMADLRSFAAALSPRETARLLIYRPRYGAETLFTGIHRLTERAVATFGGALDLHYPEPALHVRPRALAEDGDVLAAFTEAIDNALDRRPFRPDTTAFHLTGGFDSGTIATWAARRWPGQLSTGALLVIGAGRKQQLRRRKQLRDGLPFGERDFLVDCRHYPPLHPDCARVRGDVISPYEEPLHYPFAQLTAQLVSNGARALVTGLGGDEMVALSAEESDAVALANAHITEKLPWLGPRARAALEFSEDSIAPPAVVNSMTLLSLETTAPPLLRVGVWPLHPFTDPDMIRLGEELPMHWREFKSLQRRQLASLGLSDDVTNPVERESFVWLVEHSLKTYGVPLMRGMLTQGSALFDAGLVDPDGLVRTLDELGHQPYDEEYHAKLLQVIDLHLAAQAFLS
ncbi:asparagine synthase [Streptosporangium sandarakinum]